VLQNVGYLSVNVIRLSGSIFPVNRSNTTKLEI